MKFVVAFGSLLLVIFLLVIGVSYLFQPKDNLLTDEQKVMTIAVAYIEKNYGTDYVLNGGVSNQSLTESRSGIDTVYNYPTASFRMPSDYFESGQIVNVMVDPDKEEIVKVFPSPSKAFPSYGIEALKWEAQVSQGESISLGITLSLIYSEKEKTVSFSLEPLRSDYPFPFEATFEPEQLVLNHKESKNVTLILKADNDAPLGRYSLIMGAYDGSKGIGATFKITVVE